MSKSFSSAVVAGIAFLACALTSTASLEAQRRPHNQDRPPGPALTPAEAKEGFELPEGFHLELVASEPELVNPIKMAFDARGRIWVVESLEYPRRSAGPGRDRVKVLEDRDDDGAIDHVEIFADGLNIPCGIALGHGGVFVTNSPDILFLKDTDGDGRADHREVLLTGFGRHDTHELPNTLTWGPDGWLYGLNGVFNPARIEHQGKRHEFTCALWRYHPRTRDFEVFAEGTSNPWGVGFDREGAAFVEACVIDHLFHLTETGYYHRQAGAYPPFTWKIESIVEHRYYKAAYCGLDFYDADVYPEEYRNLVYFGNIHGSCINADRLERRGSTYFARAAPTILKTDDAWFMPVDIRLGPDGLFYVLDWYDRYHCYQDARRDPEGIDRGKGRLWRIAYGERRSPGSFDLRREPDEKLIERLGHANRFWRDMARQILVERRDAEAYPRLRQIVLDSEAARPARMQALWTLLGCDDPGASPVALADEFHRQVLALDDAGLRAWGVRAAGNLREVSPAIRRRVAELAADASPDVRLQVAVASRKLFQRETALELLLDVLVRSEGDRLIPKIVWRNLEPLLERHGEALVAWLHERDAVGEAAIEPLLGRMVDRLLARKQPDLASLAGMVGLLLDDLDAHRKPATQCLQTLATSIQRGEMRPETIDALQPTLAVAIGRLIERGPDEPLFLPAAAIAVAWGQEGALARCEKLLEDERRDVEQRMQALQVVLSASNMERRDRVVLEAAQHHFSRARTVSRELLLELLSALGRLESREVARVVTENFEALPQELRPQAIDLLCQRPAWAHALLRRIDAGEIPSTSLNVTQVRRLLALGDPRIEEQVTETWGTLRQERDPQRASVIESTRQMLAESGPGDPFAGKAVYEKTCAQCHKLFGEGQEVGPDITVNGRETLDLLLSNMLDPNLVVGKDYYTRTVITRDGRVLSGLLTESSPQRIVLKVAGGKLETVPRRDVLKLDVTRVSLMPEELEKTITQAELRDLIAYLRLDAPLPEPVETVVASGFSPGDAALAVQQEPGELRVAARFPGDDDRRELFRYRHSNDQRPFLHPLRSPSGVVLTALRPDDHPWQYGVFSGHARVNGLDFWHEKGWIRSRGLSSVEHRGDAVRFRSVSHWLTERRGGQRVLVEEQLVTVPAPVSPSYYVIDIEWKLTCDAPVTVGEYEYGGIAFRPADHEERRHVRPAESRRRSWQAMSGKFAGGRGGVAIFDHPSNPRYPALWRVDGQGLINPAITAGGDLALDAGESVTYRYRLVVHDGHGDAGMLGELYEAWTRSVSAQK